MARGTGFVGSQTEEVFSAPLTLSPIRVPLAIGTVAAVSGGAIELRVKVALLGAAIAVTGYSQRYQGLPRCRFLLRGFGGRDLKEGAWFPAPITEGPLGLVGGISKKKKKSPPKYSEEILQPHFPRNMWKSHGTPACCRPCAFNTDMLRATCQSCLHLCICLPTIPHVPARLVVLTQTLAGALGCGPAPWAVIEER